ncbi:tetratricopeptide repeat protein [Cytobacillus dafuensis]|uniref:Tetratricopeptide repeat protein n=1 Tax=Cytobacillus dafuensis TaxID=1742359 RepID=A0A5B8Z6U7_CYTDA|nr:tetratricopeptide repeat protein [Cytobacillus dafuensis]QED48825.1 tetratricopeptide repeat protein [Cytobacillus dafuensis]
MKKRDRKKLNDKIILFPDLEKRLMEKGLECLQQKKFREAIEYLEGAMALEHNDNEIHIGLVLAYFEAGRLSEAKELANSMLQKGLGDYIQIIDLYLMILVQLHQYDEIVATIEILIEEKEIPHDKLEQFTRLLEFSKRMIDSNQEIGLTEGPADEHEPNHQELNLISINDQQEQIMLAAQLAERNIRPFIDEIKSYLQLKEGQPFFKTMLLNVLTEHEYEKEVIVEKLDRKQAFKPANLLGVHEQTQMKRLFHVVANQLEHEDPILYEHIKSLIARHNLIIYPFQLEPFMDEVWGAAYHSLAAEYLGLSQSLEELSQLYHVKEEELIRAGLILMKIEEISSANL